MDPEQKHLTKRINAFENKCYREVSRVSWTEHRTNQSVADELGVTSGTLLNFSKKQKLSYFTHIKLHQTLEKLILEGQVKGQRHRERPNRSREKDVDRGKCLTSGTIG